VKSALRPRLSLNEIEQELRVRPGLIPVAIDLPAGGIVWADLEEFHCYQGLFHNALDFWTSLRGSPPESFATSLDALESIRVPADSISPTAFIFHAGRCGSTLLAQVLARSRENMVFAEAMPHNHIWRAASVGAPSFSTPAAALAFRNLFLLMGRRRLPSYRSHIVKFTSFNILKYARIRAAFPGVPALFLFRDPFAVLASCYRESPSWMGRELGIGHVFNNPETAVEAFFRAALSIEDPCFRCLDYARLTPQSISEVLTFLGSNSSSEAIRTMSEGFSWDARILKSDARARLFASRTRSTPPVDAVPAALLDLYARLTTWHPL